MIDKKDQLEEQYRALEDLANEFYPNINQTISIVNNMTAETMILQDYLNLTMQTPPETSSNHVSI